MSDEIPRDDAEDVLRSIRSRSAREAAFEPANEAAPDTESAGAGTFLLTSVHRVGTSDADPPGEERDAGERGAVVPIGRGGSSRSDRAAGQGPRHKSADGPRYAVRHGPTNGDRAGWAPPAWSGPAPPDRQTLGERDRTRIDEAQRGAVPGLEDPSDGIGSSAGADTVRARAVESDPLATDPRAGSGAGDVDAFDDARLRRIVEEVLEDRLQGEMGQRITRNLRALVRREVLRVLAEKADEGDGPPE